MNDTDVTCSFKENRKNNSQILLRYVGFLIGKVNIKIKDFITTSEKRLKNRCEKKASIFP